MVIGVGNPYRRDDGVGISVATSVRALAGGGVEVVELDGEPARLLDAWSGADLAVIIDAVHTGAPPGTIHRLEADATVAERSASSHGLGLQHAVALGRAVGQLPARLVLVGVEGVEFGDGQGLSTAVAAAVEPAARLIVDLVERGA